MADRRPLSVEEARTRFGRLIIVRDEHGDAMKVIRPESPALALAIAQTALAKNDGALFDRLPEEVGRYTYRGLLGRAKGDGYWIVDEHGHIIEALEAGDSFVTGTLEKA
jgi:hypothetical protein